MPLTRRYDDALLFAHQQHRPHLRKMTDIPYISHPLAVSSLVMEFGGNEDEAIAGLLHDVLEDVGKHLEPDIEYLFGPVVLGMVRECSDAIPEPGEAKDPWLIRKQRYLAEIQEKSRGALLVTACDKLHNLSCIVRDHQIYGEGIWQRFTGRRNGVRWYYENLADRFNGLDAPPARAVVLKLAELDWHPRYYEAPNIP